MVAILSISGGYSNAIQPFDFTPPLIFVQTPTIGDTYMLNERVVAFWSTADASGISFENASSFQGQFVDTSFVGEHLFVIQAMDMNQNHAQAEIRYNVFYDIEGLGSDGSLLVNANEPSGSSNSLIPIEGRYASGDVIELKFRIQDALGEPYVIALPIFSIVEISIDQTGNESAILLTETIDYHVDPSTGIYTFEYDTFGLEAGIYDLWIAYGDGRNSRTRVELQ